MGKQLPFLEGHTVPRTFRSLWASKLDSGWMRIYARLSQIPPEERTEVFYARLMLLELERDHPRFSILQRLKGGFNVGRQKRELRELTKVIT